MEDCIRNAIEETYIAQQAYNAAVDNIEKDDDTRRFFKTIGQILTDGHVGQIVQDGTDPEKIRRSIDILGDFIKSDEKQRRERKGPHYKLDCKVIYLKKSFMRASERLYEKAKEEN